ncbi:MAG: L-threonine 3-dehydrogenase [Bacillota bacterium]|nr:MAG: L-threonine 3-dehydrogenase [Bacillota bacterium]
MKALIKPEAGPGLKLAEVDVPEPGRGQCLVKVEAASICGTDLHIYQWDPWAASRLKPPLIVGHEFAGRVVAVGEDVTSVAVGDYVAGEGHLFCGECYYCRTGSAHICERGQIIGVDTDGCFAEYIRMPAVNLWKLDEDVPPEVGAIHDPLGNAVHTVMAAGVSGRRVAVVGCGPIGLVAIAVARRAGASAVFAIDPNPYRRELARRMGADAVLAAGPGEDPASRVRELTQGRGADVVLEMSGHPAGIDSGLDMLRKGGRMVLLGLPPNPVTLDLTEKVIFKEATLIGVNGRRLFETWYQTAELLRTGLDVTPVITHEFKMEDFEQAFAALMEGRCGKIVLKP